MEGIYIVEENSCKVCNFPLETRLIVERMRFRDKKTLEEIVEIVNEDFVVPRPTEQAVGKLNLANLSNHFIKHVDEEGFWSWYEKVYGTEFAERMRKGEV